MEEKGERLTHASPFNPYRCEKRRENITSLQSIPSFRFPVAGKELLSGDVGLDAGDTRYSFDRSQINGDDLRANLSLPRWRKHQAIVDLSLNHSEDENMLVKVLYQEWK